MKFLFPFLLLVGSVLCAPYSTKYDNINVDEILGSDRLLNNYFKCLMEKGPCSPDGDELKKVLPDAIRTLCDKCNDIQRENTQKITKFLIQNKPQMWTDLTKHYDPENMYFDKFRAKLGI